MADTTIMNVEQMARAMYGVSDRVEPTKSQTNRVSELCREGKLSAAKAGRRWLIKVEWSQNHDQTAS